MSTTDTAKDYGNRLLEHRNMLGWTQKTLADKAGVTYQAISKYEREGIHDVEMISRLSGILGHNLLESDKDQEGTVGEIGQEILALLLENSGVVPASYLLDGQELYGLSSKDVHHELMKLKNIGMIVRHQYSDFDGKEYDLVFITAKGIIGYKHLTGNAIDSSRNVKSYEQYCKNLDCYQYFVDADPAQSRINQLKTVGSYRYHLIRYIRNTYQIPPLGWMASKPFKEITNLLEVYTEYLSDKIPARGIPDNVKQETVYQMIMQSMIRLVTRKKLDADYGPYINYDESKKIVESLFEDAQLEESELLDQLVGNDLEEEYLLHSLADTMEISYEVLDVNDPERIGNILKKYRPKEYDDIQAKLIEVRQQIKSNDESDVDDYIAIFGEKDGFDPKVHSDNEIYEYWSDLKGNPCPLNWFSKEEIEAFIKDNYLPASTDEEKAVEADIQFILTQKPHIAKSFFSFPLEWKLNGLADMVLDVFDVRHVFTK